MTEAVTGERVVAVTDALNAKIQTGNTTTFEPDPSSGRFADQAQIETVEESFGVIHPEYTEPVR